MVLQRQSTIIAIAILAVGAVGALMYHMYLRWQKTTSVAVEAVEDVSKKMGEAVKLASTIVEDDARGLKNEIQRLVEQPSGR